MINAKEAYLKSQSPEIVEKLRKEREAHTNMMLQEISSCIESAIQRNATETFFHRTATEDVKKILREEGYKVSTENAIGTRISWNDTYAEANDILKGVIADEPKKKWWKRWRKE